jgi:hypothetical protein
MGTRIFDLRSTRNKRQASSKGGYLPLRTVSSALKLWLLGKHHRRGSTSVRFVLLRCMLLAAVRFGPVFHCSLNAERIHDEQDQAHHQHINH